MTWIYTDYKGDYGHPITRMIKGDTYFRYYPMMLNT